MLEWQSTTNLSTKQNQNAYPFLELVQELCVSFQEILCLPL